MHHPPVPISELLLLLSSGLAVLGGASQAADHLRAALPDFLFASDEALIERWLEKGRRGADLPWQFRPQDDWLSRLFLACLALRWPALLFVAVFAVGPYPWGPVVAAWSWAMLAPLFARRWRRRLAGAWSPDFCDRHRLAHVGHCPRCLAAGAYDRPSATLRR